MLIQSLSAEHNQKMTSRRKAKTRGGGTEDGLWPYLTILVLTSPQQPFATAATTAAASSAVWNMQPWAPLHQRGGQEEGGTLNTGGEGGGGGGAGLAGVVKVLVG